MCSGRGCIVRTLKVHVAVSPWFNWEKRGCGQGKLWVYSWGPASCVLGELGNYSTRETFPMPCISSSVYIKYTISENAQASWQKLQFPLRNYVGERIFIHSPILLTKNTPSHTQWLHGYAKTWPRPRFSAICNVSALWLAQGNLISRKELMEIFSLEKISLGPENEPGTDGLSPPIKNIFTVCQQRAWLKGTICSAGNVQNLTLCLP